MKKKLFVLPFAGGKADSFLVYKKRLSSDIDIVELDFPGRGKQRALEFADSMESLVASVFDCLCSSLKPDETYSVMGHSMGAYVAFELVLKLQKSDMRLPDELILSGSPVFDILKKDSFYQLKEITRDDIYELMLSNGWVKKNFLYSRLFKNLIYNKLYTDLKLMIKYKISDEKIDERVRVSVLWGENDKYGLDAYEGWCERCCGTVDIKCLPGNHFFIFDNLDDNSAFLNNILSRKYCKGRDME